MGLRNLDFILYVIDKSWEALNIINCDIKGNVKSHIFILIQLFKLHFCLFLSVHTCMHIYQRINVYWVGTYTVLGMS